MIDFEVREKDVVVKTEGLFIKNLKTMLWNTMKVRLIGKIVNRKNGLSPTKIKLNVSHILLSVFSLT